jgi:hypothetical protein
MMVHAHSVATVAKVKSDGGIQTKKPVRSGGTSSRGMGTSKDANLPSLSNFDAFTNIVVSPGQTINLTSSADWTGADHVAIGISCPPSTSLQKVQLLVTWGMSLAPFYTSTSVIQGSNLLFSNMGGAVVSAFGNHACHRSLCDRPET